MLTKSSMWTGTISAKSNFRTSHIMDPTTYDPRKSGNRWIAYFDRLGFKAYCKSHDPVDVFCESCAWLTIAEQACEGLSDVNLVWFSDTLLFYSMDDSRESFQAVDGASTSFFDELIDSQIPARGALALDFRVPH